MGPPTPLPLRPVRAGDFMYVTGHAAPAPEPPPQRAGGSWLPGETIPGGIEAETRQTLENLKQALEAAGSSLRDVVKVNTFLRDVDRDFLAYNRIYLEYFPAEPPARTSVGARIYGNILIEIECIAYAPLQDPAG